MATVHMRYIAGSLATYLVGSIAAPQAQAVPPSRVISLARCQPLPTKAVSQLTDAVAATIVVEARRCRVSTKLNVSVLNDLSESPRAWPIVEVAGQPRQSLKNALSSTVWFKDTRPIRVRMRRDRLIILGDGRGAAVGFVMTSYASQTLDDGEAKAFVAVRLKPSACLVSVRHDIGSAVASLRAARIPCLPERAS